MDPEFITITGSDGREHRVPAHLVDYFYNGDDGSPVTDEQWNESKRRAEQLDAWPFPVKEA